MTVKKFKKLLDKEQFDNALNYIRKNKLVLDPDYFLVCLQSQAVGFIVNALESFEFSNKYYYTHIKLSEEDIFSIIDMSKEDDRSLFSVILDNSKYFNVDISPKTFLHACIMGKTSIVEYLVLDESKIKLTDDDDIYRFIDTYLESPHVNGSVIMHILNVYEKRSIHHYFFKKLINRFPFKSSVKLINRYPQKFFDLEYKKMIIKLLLQKELPVDAFFVKGDFYELCKKFARCQCPESLKSTIELVKLPLAIAILEGDLYCFIRLLEIYRSLVDLSLLRLAIINSKYEIAEYILNNSETFMHNKGINNIPMNAKTFECIVATMWIDGAKIVFAKNPKVPITDESIHHAIKAGDIDFFMQLKAYQDQQSIIPLSLKETLSHVGLFAHSSKLAEDYLDTAIKAKHPHMISFICKQYNLQMPNEETCKYYGVD